MSNLISAEITEEAIGTAKIKIEELKQSLPFLIAIPAGEKQRKRTMGQKSVEYVSLALRGASNFEQYLARSFNTEEFRKDAALVSKLWEIRVPLAALLESVDDTIFAASSDAMKSADEVYRSMKDAARKDASVKLLVEEMKKRFSYKLSKTAQETGDKP